MSYSILSRILIGLFLTASLTACGGGGSKGKAKVTNRQGGTQAQQNGPTTQPADTAQGEQQKVEAPQSKEPNFSQKSEENSEQSERSTSEKNETSNSPVVVFRPIAKSGTQSAPSATVSTVPAVQPASTAPAQRVVTQPAAPVVARPVNTAQPVVTTTTPTPAQPLATAKSTTPVSAPTWYQAANGSPRPQVVVQPTQPAVQAAPQVAQPAAQSAQPVTQPAQVAPTVKPTAVSTESRPEVVTAADQTAPKVNLGNANSNINPAVRQEQTKSQTEEAPKVELAKEARREVVLKTDADLDRENTSVVQLGSAGYKSLIDTFSRKSHLTHQYLAYPVEANIYFSSGDFNPYTGSKGVYLPSNMAMLLVETQACDFDATQGKGCFGVEVDPKGKALGFYIATKNELPKANAPAVANEYNQITYFKRYIVRPNANTQKQLDKIAKVGGGRLQVFSNK